MPGAVFLNGVFVDEPGAARIGALDAGVQHGVGLFETLSAGVQGGQPWAVHLDEHLDLLARSARDLGLSATLNTSALGDALLETVRRAGLERARVRVTITGGETSLLAQAQRGATAPTRDATVLIVATPATAYPPELFERGATVTLADAKANPFNPHESHKTLNYWWRLRDLGLAAAKGAGEALVFSVTNHLCGGCVSNAILIKGSQAFTPLARGEERDGERDGARQGGREGAGRGVVLPSPVRPGVVRDWAIHELLGEGVIVRRELVTISDVLEADEIMLTNSGWGVLPVKAVEARSIGAGGPGPLSRLLRERWERLIESGGVG